MKTKLHIVFFLATFLVELLSAQDLRQRMDMPPGGICRDMFRLPGGSTIVVGEMSGAPIPFGWVSMLSETGDILWTKIPFDQKLASRFMRVLPDTDSTFLIGGTQYIDPVNGTDLLLIRMTHKGKVMWSRTVHFNQADLFSDMDLFEKGAILVGTTLDDATGVDIVVAVMDEKGNPGITRQFGAAGLEHATHVRFAGPYGFYISGTTSSYTFPGQTPSAFLMQLSPSISLSWMRLIGDADEQSLESMALGASGFPMIGVHDFGGLGLNYICQFNHQGSLEYAKSYNSGRLRAMTRSSGAKIFVADDHIVSGLDHDGNVITSWLLQPEDGFTTSCLQIGEKGQYLLGGWFHDGQDYPAMHAIVEPSTSMCDVGTVISYAQDYSPNIINELINEFDAGQVDLFTLPMIDILVNKIVDCQSVSLTKSVEHTLPLTAFPNPTKDFVTLDLPFGFSGILNWYRLDGTLVGQRQFESISGAISQDLSSWPAGGYLVEFLAGDQRWTATLLRTD